MHQDIEESLREALRCFSHELCLACLTMLGRASEGAWIELGIKLAEAEGSKKGEKLKEDFESPRTGIAEKIGEVAKFYSNKDLFSQIYDESGIKAQDLVNSMVWADVVRESRNSVHYGVKPSMPKSYEKVAYCLSVPCHISVCCTGS